MDNLSKFSETLDELMFEHKITVAQLASAVDISADTIYRYINSQSTPSVETIVKLADYFDCTADFLLGRESENYSQMFLPCPAFSERLKTLKAHFGCTWQQFYKTAKISPSRFYEWKNGNRIPSLDSIIALADGFDVSVDFILGRTIG